MHDVASLIRVLLIEDNPADTRLLKETLKEAGAHFRLETADRLEDGLRLLSEKAFDVLLLDLNLPESSGLETLTRACAHTPSVPIVILTGLADEQLGLDAIQQGASDYLVKGEVNPGVLVRSLRYAIERKQAEDAMRKSAARLLSIFRAAPVGIGVVIQRVITEANERLCGMTGFSRNELVGQSARILYPDQEEFEFVGREKYRQIRETGTGTVETTWRRKDGTVFDVILSSTPIDPADWSGDVMFTALDITERKRMETELQETKERLQLAAQSAELGIWDLDVTTDKLIWDRTMFDLYGLAPEQFSGAFEAWSARVLPDDYARAEQEFQRALAGEKPFNTEFRIIRPDNSIRFIRARGEVYRDPDGKPVRMVGMNWDITEQRKLEDQYRQAQKMEAVGAFAGGVAHDFNNILNVIVGYAALLKMHEAEGTQNRQYLDEILAATERASHLTHGLLAFSRKTPTTRRPTDINASISQVGKMIRRVIGEDIELQIDIHPQPLVVMADSVQLDQIILNLGTNARDAMPKGGKMTIRTTYADMDARFIKERGFGSPGKYAVIEIADTGSGMDEDTRRHIFEPFFTTKEAGKGTGLGLSIGYGIIKQHQGFIDCSSVLGTGTRFTIYLPLVEPMNREQQPETLDHAPLRGGAETILLAEDDDSSRSVMRSTLKKFGYTVIEAKDGADAVRQFRANKRNIQLLLFDVIMPKLNGIEVLQAIRAEAPQVRSMFITGYNDDFLKTRGLLVEGLRYITKPVFPDALLRGVRETLDEQEASHDRHQV